MARPTFGRSFSGLLLLAGACSGLTGCSDEKITAYRIPKEASATQAPAQPPGGTAMDKPAPPAFNTNDLPVSAPGETPPPAPAAGGMDSVPVQAESGSSLLWAVPAGWLSKPGSAMRKGTFDAGGGAEVAITAFPGDVGGLLGNVNRWRRQAGLSEVDDAGLAQAVTPLDANGLRFFVVDASGGASPVVAALVPWNGGTWFFKLTGPPAAVARARPAFLSFLGTVHTPR